MFSPGFWSAFDPVAFPYGDGVFGLEREANLNYEEWCRCLMARDELEYDVDEEHPAADAGGALSGAPDPESAPVVGSSSLPVPRWRRHADLLTAQYCLWRRKAIIKAARAFVCRQHFGESLADLATLSADDLVQVVAVLGKGAGLKDAMANESQSSIRYFKHYRN